MAGDIEEEPTYRGDFESDGTPQSTKSNKTPQSTEKKERKRSKSIAQLVASTRRASVITDAIDEDTAEGVDGGVRLPSIKGPKSLPEKGEKRESMYASGNVMGDALKKKVIKLQNQLADERKARQADEAKYQAQIKRLEAGMENVEREKEELDEVAANKAKHAKKMRARLASVVEDAKGSIQAAKKKASEFKAKYTEATGTVQEQLEQMQVNYERVAKSNAKYKRKYARICKALGEDFAEDEEELEEGPPEEGPELGGEAVPSDGKRPAAPQGIVGRLQALQEDRNALAQRLKVSDAALQGALKDKQAAEAELGLRREERDKAEAKKDRYLAKVKEVFAAMGEEYVDAEEVAPAAAEAAAPPKPPKGSGRASGAGARGKGLRASVAATVDKAAAEAMGRKPKGPTNASSGSVLSRLQELRDELVKLRAELVDSQTATADARADLEDLTAKHETVSSALQNRDAQLASTSDQAALLGLQVKALSERLNTLGDTVGLPEDVAAAVLGQVEAAYRDEKGKGGIGKKAPKSKGKGEGVMEQLTPGKTAGETKWAGILEKVSQDKDEAAKAKLAAEIAERKLKEAQRELSVVQGAAAAVEVALATSVASTGPGSSAGERVAFLVKQRKQAEEALAREQRDRQEAQAKLAELNDIISGATKSADGTGTNPVAKKMAHALEEKLAAEKQVTELEAAARENEKVQKGLSRALWEVIGAYGQQEATRKKDSELLQGQALLEQGQMLARVVSASEATTRAELREAKQSADAYRAKLEDLQVQLSTSHASLNEQGKQLSEHSMKEVLLQEQIRQMLHENKRLGGRADDARAKARMEAAAQRVRDICMQYVSKQDEQAAMLASGRRYSLALTIPKQVNPLCQMATYEVDMLVNDQLTAQFQVEPGNSGIFQAAIHYFHINPEDGDTTFDTTLPPGSQSSNMLVDLVMVPMEGARNYIARKGDILGLCIRVRGNTFRNNKIEQLPPRELVYNNNVLRASEVVGAVPEEQRSKMTHISIWPDLTSSWRWMNSPEGWKLMRIRWRFLLKKCFPDIADSIQTLVTRGQEN